jgi:cytoskeletal protein CcmA (bactofilin family)
MARHSGNDRNESAGKESGLSVVAVGMRIIGQLDTNGIVKVEGFVAGSIRAERQVLVAKGGVVEGDVLTREAVIGGEVRGAIYADERVEVQTTSQIHGDITTKRILLQEGGEVNGHLKMEDPKALSRDIREVRKQGKEVGVAEQAPDIQAVKSDTSASKAAQKDASSSGDLNQQEYPADPQIRKIGLPKG